MVEPVNQQEGNQVNAATFAHLHVVEGQDQQVDVRFPLAIVDVLVSGWQSHA